jgi:hypothetical protein
MGAPNHARRSEETPADQCGTPSATARGARSQAPEAGAAHPAWTEIEGHLQSARRSILEEIRNHPTPIAGCDQQFDYLLEQRDRISDELDRLVSVRGDNITQENGAEVLIHLINASACIDDELKLRLTSELNRRFGDAS